MMDQRTKPKQWWTVFFGPIQVLSRQFPNAQQGKGAALNHAFQIVLADAEKKTTHEIKYWWE